MKLVDQELEFELPRGALRSVQISVKSVDHQYEFTDYNDRTYMGRGPTKLVVHGFATTEEREVLNSVAGRGALYTFYYPSQQGGEDDRYYQRVVVLPPSFDSHTANVHEYSIEMHALDGHVYDTETGRQVD